MRGEVLPVRDESRKREEAEGKSESRSKPECSSCAAVPFLPFSPPPAFAVG